MQLRIRAGALDDRLDARHAIERGVRLALGRHAAGIEIAQVTVSPGKDGVRRNRCRIRVRFQDGEGLDVEGFGENPLAASEAAIWRLGNRLRRQPHERTGTATAGWRAPRREWPRSAPRRSTN